MASFAVVTSHETLEAYVLSGMKSVQAAELIVATRGAVLGLGQDRYRNTCLVSVTQQINIFRKQDF